MAKSDEDKDVSEYKEHVDNLRKLQFTLIAISLTLLSVFFLGSNRKLEKALKDLNDIIEVADRGKYQSLGDMIVNNCYQFRKLFHNDSLIWGDLLLGGISLGSRNNIFPSQTYKLPDLPVVFSHNYRELYLSNLETYYNVFDYPEFKFETLSEFIFIWDMLAKSEEIVYVDGPVKRGYLIQIKDSINYDTKFYYDRIYNIDILDSFKIEYCNSLEFKTVEPIRDYFLLKEFRPDYGDSISIRSDSLYYEKILNPQLGEKLIQIFSWNPDGPPCVLVLDSWKSSSNVIYQLLVPINTLYVGYNLQEQFILDNQAYLSSKWQLGSFNDVFPELSIYTNAMLQGLPIKSLKTKLSEETYDSNQNFSVFGIDIPAFAVGTVGPLILICIIIYFLIHLQYFISIEKFKNIKTNIPWIALYSGLVSKIFTLISTAILPCFTVGWLILSTENNIFYKIGGTTIAIILLVLIIYQFTDFWLNYESEKIEKKS